MDLYTPRYVKGSGSDKVGLCPICIEPISRGGEGNKLFLKTKVSAYSKFPNPCCARSSSPQSATSILRRSLLTDWLHLVDQTIICSTTTVCTHVMDPKLPSLRRAPLIGICARSNMPFSPPLESRITARPRASIKERKEIKEGLCHSCQQWIPLQGTKDVEVMVKEIFWYVFFFISFFSSFGVYFAWLNPFVKFGNEARLSPPHLVSGAIGWGEVGHLMFCTPSNYFLFPLSFRLAIFGRKELA